MSAGALRARFAFDKPGAVSDGAGAIESGFEQQFVCAVELAPKFAGETVQQARLQGVSTFTVRLRSSIAARQVTAAWRCRDVRSSPAAADQVVYAIISGPIDVEGKRAWLEFLMQTGKAP